MLFLVHCSDGPDETSALPTSQLGSTLSLSPGVMWGSPRFRSPEGSTSPGAAPDERFRRRWATRRATLSLANYWGSRADLPSPCSSQLKPRGCHRVQHFITILDSIWVRDSAQQNWSNQSKYEVIKALHQEPSISSCLCTVAQTGVRIG